MNTFQRTRALTLGTLVASAIALGTAGSAAAEQVEIFSAGGTFNSTAESGTGKMTSNASTTGLGGAPQEPRQEIRVDNFGRVNAGLQIEGGATYRVTTTLDGARTTESASGSATARGFVEVELYDCCFAGEATLLTTKEAELPSIRGQVQVVQDVFVPRDTMLTPNVSLHSYAAAFVDSTDTATVDSSTETTSIDISPLGEPEPQPEPEPEPGPGNGGGGGLVGDLLGDVGKIVGITRNPDKGTATIAMKMSEPAEMSLARTSEVRPATKTADEPDTLRLKVGLRNDEMRKLAREAERKGRAATTVKVELTCDPDEGRAYSTTGRIRLVLKG